MTNYVERKLFRYFLEDNIDENNLSFSQRISYTCITKPKELFNWGLLLILAITGIISGALFATSLALPATVFLLVGIPVLIAGVAAVTVLDSFSKPLQTELRNSAIKSLTKDVELSTKFDTYKKKHVDRNNFYLVTHPVIAANTKEISL